MIQEHQCRVLYLFFHLYGDNYWHSCLVCSRGAGLKMHPDSGGIGVPAVFEWSCLCLQVYLDHHTDQDNILDKHHNSCPLHYKRD